MNGKMIKVKMANQYGTAVLLPVCDKAKLFAAIAGTKTLTRDAIAKIKLLGYTVAVEQLPETL